MYFIVEKADSNKSDNGRPERKKLIEVKNNTLKKRVNNSDSESSSVDTTIDSAVRKQTTYVQNRNFENKSEESDRSSTPENNTMMISKSMSPILDFPSAGDVHNRQQCCNDVNLINDLDPIVQYKTISLEDIFRMDLPDLVPVIINTYLLI